MASTDEVARQSVTRSLLQTASIIAALYLLTPISALGFTIDPVIDADPPFAICHDQKYALCAEASCFVYDGVAYCKCNSLNGDSISLQLSFSTPLGTRNVSSVNRQGRTNGYMISTFSFPNNVQKGGPAAVYTCPGSADSGSGVSAPVAYGQCDGGFCFKSTRNQIFPGLGKLSDDEIICSCPISTGATPGSSDSLGYQI